MLNKCIEVNYTLLVYDKAGNVDVEKSMVNISYNMGQAVNNITKLNHDIQDISSKIQMMEQPLYNETVTLFHIDHLLLFFRYISENKINLSSVPLDWLVETYTKDNEITYDEHIYVVKCIVELIKLIKDLF